MKSISFTGHRKMTEDRATISRRLYKRLEMEIHSGATNFNTGGAAGFDCLSATVVLKLREVYPHIKLNLILPCSNDEQTKKMGKGRKGGFLPYSLAGEHCRIYV